MVPLGAAHSKLATLAAYGVLLGSCHDLFRLLCVT